MKRFLSIVLIVILLTVGVFSFSEFKAYVQNVFVFSDYSGKFKVSFSGRHADILYIVNGSIEAGVDVGYNISAVCAYDDTVVLCCDDPEHDQLVVYTYNPRSDYLDSFVVSGCMIYSDSAVCCDDSSIYIVSSVKNNALYRYSLQGNLQKTYFLDNEITQVFHSYDGEVYAFSRGDLYRVGNNVIALSGDEVASSLFPIDINYIASLSGEVYQIINNEAVYLFTAESDNNASGACIIGDTLFYPYANTIYGYHIPDGKKTSYYQCGATVNAVYSDGDSLIAMNLNDNEIRYIDINEFARLDSDDKEISPSPQSNDHRSEEAIHKEISSDVYSVDNDAMRIYDIPDETTIGSFKRNMFYDGYTLRLYRNNSEKKSGNVGTAWQAVFSDEESSVTYELSVVGDITGEGNCNSRDINLLMDYLIGTADFNGVYIISADLNCDNAVNVVDLALMKRKII